MRYDNIRRIFTVTSLVLLMVILYGSHLVYRNMVVLRLFADWLQVLVINRVLAYYRFLLLVLW